MSQERPPPGGLSVTGRARDNLWRQAADRPAVAVDQSGLPGERLAVARHPDDVVAGLAQPARRDDTQFARVPEYLRDGAAQPPRGDTGVELGLDDDAAVDDVQGTPEPEHRGHFRLAAARLGDFEAGQLILHGSSHGHALILPCSKAAA